jgi:hypothetical protein
MPGGLKMVIVGIKHLNIPQILGRACNILSSCEKKREKTSLPHLRKQSPSSRCQMRTVQSALPENRFASSSEKARERTEFVCPCKSFAHWPSSVVHTRISVSILPEQSVPPSLDNIRAVIETASECPNISWVQPPANVSQHRTVPSAPAEYNQRASRERMRAVTPPPWPKTLCVEGNKSATCDQLEGSSHLLSIYLSMAGLIYRWLALSIDGWPQACHPQGF